MPVPFYQRLRRITAGAPYQPEIDGIRFLAILLVMLLHLHGYFLAKNTIPFTDSPDDYPWLERAANAGGAGVELFFILSGFVLALPFARYYLAGGQKIALRQYYLRRLQRIEPPYIIALLLSFTSIVIMAPDTVQVQTRHLMASLVYMHNFIFHTPGSLHIGVWSLEVEVQFYIVAPLIFMAFRLRKGRRRLVLGGLFVLAVAAKYIYRIPFMCLYQQLSYFLAGIILADIYVSSEAEKISGNPGLLVAGIAALLIIVFYIFPEELERCILDLMYPAVAVVLYYSVLKSRWMKAAFSFGMIPVIGGMCYSIYLLHYPILSFFGKYTMRLRVSNYYLVNIGLQFLLLSTAVLIGCGAYYYVIERRFMRRNVFGKKPL